MKVPKPALIGEAAPFDTLRTQDTVSPIRITDKPSPAVKKEEL
jgi:hypothetical protein